MEKSKESVSHWHRIWLLYIIFTWKHKDLLEYCQKGYDEKAK
jgi:hypothetical protein